MQGRVKTLPYKKASPKRERLDYCIKKTTGSAGGSEKL